MSQEFQEYREERLLCPECDNEIDLSQAFCTKCGARIALADLDKTFERKTRYSRRILLTIGVIILYILGNFFLSRQGYPFPPLLTDIFFLLVTIGLAAIYFSDLKKAFFNFRALFHGGMAVYILMQLAISLLIFYSMDGLEGLLGSQNLSLDLLDRYEGYSYPFLVAAISLAVFPPLTEEVTFRGILFSQLNRLTTQRITILITGFLFAWVHFRFIALFWLFPSGLFLGWIRSREGSIWPGVVCHGIHNFLVLLWNVY